MPGSVGPSHLKRRRRKRDEVIVSGQAASPGVVIGKAFLLSHGLPPIPIIKLESDQVEAEVLRFHQALNATRDQLIQLQAGLKRTLSDKTTRIFDAHLLMLDDVVAVDQTLSRIRDKRMGAEQAFSITIENLAQAFETHLKDRYLRERIEDIRDVEKRVLANLLGVDPSASIQFDARVVLVAHDLTPSQTAQLDRNFILGCATDVGGTTSHTAILSRSLEIPAVVGLGRITDLVRNGDEVIVDGFSGRVILRPRRHTVDQYYSKDKQLKDLESKLARLRELPANTTDGRFIELSANIEFPEEVASVLSHGAKGVGLFRTEFLYLTRKDLPTEQEQYHAFSEVARRLAPDPVIIRTLDAGADKFAHQLRLTPDANPYLGLRAIRILLKRKDIFRTQLRALFRATAHGKIKILLPLISTIEELKKALAFIRKVHRELEQERVPMAERVQVGIMIEVPSAAMLAEEFVRLVDFISIGTNDLIQYIMATDRGNEKVAHLYQPLNPAVIRMINMVVTAAKRSNTWVGVCGEMAGYPPTALLLVGLGVDELSTSPTAIPGIKKIIRSISFKDARKIAEKVLSLTSTARIKNYLIREVEALDRSLTGLYGES